MADNNKSKEEMDYETEEMIQDFNPDDLEKEDDLHGFKIVNGKKIRIDRNRDLNPDDFE